MNCNVVVFIGLDWKFYIERKKRDLDCCDFFDEMSDEKRK